MSKNQKKPLVALLAVFSLYSSLWHFSMLLWAERMEANNRKRKDREVDNEEVSENNTPIDNNNNNLIHSNHK